MKEKLKIPYSVVTETKKFLQDISIISHWHPLDKPISRDGRDDPILVLADQNGAEIVVTGDKDLLVLKRYKKSIIATPRDFYDSTLRSDTT
jgi:predicted nucleic acid-binding protein